MIQLGHYIVCFKVISRIKSQRFALLLPKKNKKIQAAKENLKKKFQAFQFYFYK